MVVQKGFEARRSSFSPEKASSPVKDTSVVMLDGENDVNSGPYIGEEREFLQTAADFEVGAMNVGPVLKEAVASVEE